MTESLASVKRVQELFNVQNTTLPIRLAGANMQFNDVFSHWINVYVFPSDLTE